MTDSNSGKSDIRQPLEQVFFTIGRVAQEVGVEQYVLRFWESKFSQISPVKRRGRRLYSRRDIEMIKKIKHMLYDLGYTIRGAQAELNRQKYGPKVASSDAESLAKLMKNLADMRDMLAEKLNGM
ncbi:MerR family transcriptional regulator [Candidatus Anaplasma sp. TIGMIC]|uniref:MerR family transcriptional regulator n=1 Tax=Candidatus Anaplasma sp. TIGMIC TaxID=3020713 RepID=UPI00232C9B8F|nr:MerR family transcriptional regulator [Candidatus Anaplasma sp. TIGMIC]MDB1135725.1 MerR family transcriptional regulator [Candidatus Anaplasma sp. TIGMIC]